MRHVINPFEPLRLTHVAFKGSFENGVWSSTLLEGDHPVAVVRSVGPDEPLQLEPRDPGAIARWVERLADPTTFADALPPAETPLDRLADLVDRLAQLRYLDRRVYVLSHRSLVYQLRDDAPHEFHYMPADDAPEELLGWLRLSAGRRLSRVIYKGRDCLSDPLASPPAAERVVRLH